MSTSIRWRPSGPNGRGLQGSYGPELKSALREEFGDGRRTLDDAAIPFLRGLRAAKVEGASELIALIEKHDSIDVWEES